MLHESSAYESSALTSAATMNAVSAEWNKLNLDVYRQGRFVNKNIGLFEHIIFCEVSFFRRQLPSRFFLYFNFLKNQTLGATHVFQSFVT